jgi:hypothetical protein
VLSTQQQVGAYATHALILSRPGSVGGTLDAVAGGKPVKGSHIEDLHKVYPNVFSKETLLSPKELARFHGHPSLLAGLDYQVCLCVHRTHFPSG